MAIIGSIFNGEAGSSVRAKLNAIISRGNTNTGWAQYRDTQYTEGSPFVVFQGQTLSLPNNAGQSIETQLPEGSTGFYNGTRLTPDANGDSYGFRVSFTVSCSVVNGAFATSLDISAAGDGSFEIYSRASSTLRGANNPQDYVFSTDIYTLDTFLANGGLPRFEAIAGDCSIYNINYNIFKQHAAR